MVYAHDREPFGKSTHPRRICGIHGLCLEDSLNQFFPEWVTLASAIAQLFKVSPDVMAKKGLLPVIEINLDLVDSEVRFQPQVRAASQTDVALQHATATEKNKKVFSRVSL